MGKRTATDFPASAVAFLRKLKQHNDKEWFESNRELFNTSVLEPAQGFVRDLGAKLQVIRPGINAIPKIDKSIFRLHRDVRFSKDKSPYKTNLGFLFWEGGGKKMESSGMYIHIEPGKVAAALGMYEFTKEQLRIYRDAVANASRRKSLLTAVKSVEEKGIQIHGRTYKQVPRGYDKEMPGAEWLLHSGLYGWHETKDAGNLPEDAFVKECLRLFKAMLPLHEWLVRVMNLK
jgi:uncharacterized protein (TIGR02453 family)